MARDWPKVKYFDMHLNGIISISIIILNPLQPLGAVPDSNSSAQFCHQRWQSDGDAIEKSTANRIRITTMENKYRVKAQTKTKTESQTEHTQKVS